MLGKKKGIFGNVRELESRGKKGAAAWLFRDGVNALRSDLALKVALLLRRSRRPPFCAVEKDTVEKSTVIQNVQFGNKLNGSDGLFHFFLRAELNLNSNIDHEFQANF